MVWLSIQRKANASECQILRAHFHKDPTPPPRKRHTLLSGEVRISDTFHAGSYVRSETIEAVKLYRVHSNGAEMGKFWTRVPPRGPLQSTLDSALAPAFNNSASKWIEITVPAKEIMYEGKAAAVDIPGGFLLGHGNQVVLDRELIPKEWVTGRGKFGAVE